MKQVPFGKTGFTVSGICLGTGNFGEAVPREQAFAILDAFTALGGNFIDTANAYCKWVPGLGNCSERIIGEWLASRGMRGRVRVATKGGHPSFTTPPRWRVTQADIRVDLEESLTALGLECIDFYWLHRDDEAVPMEELLDVMEGFVKEGKILHYGASNYRLPRMQAALAAAAARGCAGFEAVSNQWSLAGVNLGKNVNPDPSMVVLDEEYYAWHKASGMPLVPYSATAYGFFSKLQQAGVTVKDGKLLGAVPKLPEKTAAYMNERNLRIYEQLLAMQREYGVSLHALAAACLMDTRGFAVVPIGAVRNVQQLEDYAAAGSLTFDRQAPDDLAPDGLAPGEDLIATFGVG